MLFRRVVEGLHQRGPGQQGALDPDGEAADTLQGLEIAEGRDVADVYREPGYWLVAGTAVLCVYCAFRVRRVY